jgi:recombinational DNA repair ATPase RecF
MVRLRKLEIAGFRGAVGPLPLNLSSACRSVAIFGENAAGKSSLTDAIEWFYTDRVDHLWRENCKESALRNAHIDDKASSTVALEFSDATLNCKKSLSPQFNSSLSNKTREFANYHSAIQGGYERLTLRNLDLLSFIIMRKAEKRRELERIIGYEALDAFREVIGSSLYKLENSRDYIEARGSLQDNQKEIIKIARTSIPTEKELNALAERLVGEAGLTLQIFDAESYQAALDGIQMKIHAKEKAARKVALSDSRQKCVDLAGKAEKLKVSFEQFSKTYAELIKSEQQLKQIKLAELLSHGKQAVEGHLVADDMCPLCLQPKNWESLKNELEDRISKLQESKRQNDIAFSQKNQCMAKLNEAVRVGHELVSNATKTGIGGDFLRATEQYNVAAKGLEREVEESFAVYRPLSAGIETISNSFVSLLEKETERLGLEEVALALSEEEQKLFDAFQAISNLRAFFLKFRKASETVKQLQTQIQALSKIKNDFSIIHTAALQRVLDLMSKDISQYYLAMHPEENVDDIRLTVLEDGVEFDYAFHGKRVYPPLKYLSESHLNSLGIAAFLASVKLFNRVNEFLVLDDIVTSFDANHRVRLLHLLRDAFSNWQIVLLTHEPFWFELIKKEMGSSGWLFSELEVVPGFGIWLETSSKDVKELINSKKKDGTLTANELRTAMERMLKDIGFGLEVKMAFRFNDRNERRMAGELLSELRSTLKKKSPGTLSNPAFSKLETCSLVATTGSHDSGPVLSSGDITTCCEDVLSFDEQFCCGRCGTYVAAERLVSHESKAYCKCGGKCIEWKE